MAGQESPIPVSPGQKVDDESEDNLTLAQWSKSPLIPDKQNKTLENKHKLLTNKKRAEHLDSITKKVASGQARNKFASSTNVEVTSSRGKAKSSAVIRAQKVQSNLEPEFPSFVKSLVRSNVTSCFWMGLPGSFCKSYLPEKDTTITLEDQSGKEYQLKYIAYKTGLSAGWRQFSIAHKLQEGDVLVFQLVRPTKFKVYIIRADGLSGLDGVLSLLNPDSSTKKEGDKVNANTHDAAASTSSKRGPDKSASVLVPKKKRTGLSRLAPKARQSAEQSENDGEEVRSEVSEGLKPMLDFKDVKGFKNFSIIINGKPIDAEIPFEVRGKYYKLCCSQQSFLHENLIKGLNIKLIVGIISETVSIAAAIKVSTLTTSCGEFAKWDKTLLAFEYLGMKVDFLRLQIRLFISISYEIDVPPETRKYLECLTEGNRADVEIKNIETKLEALKGACDGFGAYLESLKCKSECCQLQCREEDAASS